MAPHDHPHHHHHHPHAIGHNRPPPDHTPGHTQWQTPHLDHAPPTDAGNDDAAAVDFDLVEAAFMEGFATASDPVSFLRLAGVPLVGATDDGRELCLLRIEAGRTTDVGALTPQLGGGAHSYAPLPKSMVGRRDRLDLIYTDGEAPVALSLAAARRLADRTPSV